MTAVTVASRIIGFLPRFGIHVCFNYGSIRPSFDNGFICGSGTNNCLHLPQTSQIGECGHVGLG